MPSSLLVSYSKKPMPKVFVVNFGGQDHSAALQYGEVEFITRGYVSFKSMNRVYLQIMQALAKSSPDDFLLPCGIMPINVLASAAWMRMHGTLRVLLWDSKTENYRLVEWKATHVDFLAKGLVNAEEVRQKDH